MFLNRMLILLRDVYRGGCMRFLLVLGRVGYSVMLEEVLRELRGRGLSIGLSIYYGYKYHKRGEGRSILKLSKVLQGMTPIITTASESHGITSVEELARRLITKIGRLC